MNANYKFIEEIKTEINKEYSFGTSKNYIWDEVAYSELLLKSEKSISNYIFKDVFVLAKYFHHITKMDDTSIKNELIQFFNISGYTMDNQMRFRKMFDGAIKGAKKQYMKSCRDIRITANEIEKINKLKDSTTRKMAFILLCMWKANGNKPFRCSFNKAANEIGLNVNGKKLRDVYSELMWKEKYTYVYNRNAERRKGILSKLVELDSKYGQLFIPYDSFKYEQHLLHPTRRSAIAIWRYEQDHYGTPYLNIPSYYQEMTDEEKEEYKSMARYNVNDEDCYGDDRMDSFIKDSSSLDYIMNNIDLIAHSYSMSDFARIIGGDVFYSETGAHDKIKVLFAEVDCTGEIEVDVNNLSKEYDKLLGDNRVVLGRCAECDCSIEKKSNKAKYCEKCKVVIRKEKVKVNMQKMRSRNKELA